MVKDAASKLDSSEGIQRKGVVLATLSKLKQVCNHPAQLLGDNSAIPGRSGKVARLTEMLEELIEVGDRALVFSLLAVDSSSFWSGSSLPEELFGEVRVPSVPAALLKRLGGFPFWRGEERFLEAVEPIYTQASPRGLEIFLTWR